MRKNPEFVQRVLKSPHYPWFVWGLAASFFFFEYLARVAPGAMVDNLMRDLHATAFGLGTLSAFFYYAYITMQIPVGMLVDRFSPRWLLTWMTLLTAFSCVVFASAHTVHAAALARLLLGFSSAFAFVTALKLASVWFSSNRLGLLAGMTQALGMLGASISQLVVAYGVLHIGWRSTMACISALFVLLSVSIGIFVRDRSASECKEKSTIPVPSVGSVWAGLCLVLNNPQTWWNALFIGLLYAPTEALGELWGVKFISQAHGFTNQTAAFAVGTIFAGWAIGAPLVGWFSDFIKRRKPILLGSAALSFIFISLILYVPHLTFLALFLLLFCFGISNTGVATSYVVAAEMGCSSISGTSMAFANMASVAVGAIFQPVIGFLLDKHWDGVMKNGVPVYTATDFRMALVALPICLLVAFFVAMRIRETYFLMTPEERAHETITSPIT